MFKLNKLSAVIAIGLGTALPVQAGLLDDLIGAKFNPVSTNKGVAAEGQKGSFTKPFAEPFVYERSVGDDNNPDLQGFRTDNKCEGIGANGKLRCKPAAGTISLLPNGDFLYFNALEGTEDFEFSILLDFGQKAINDQTRMMRIPEGANAASLWTRPTDVDSGANPDGYEITELIPGLSNKETNSADGALFCADVAMLADGRIMAVGGTAYYSEPGSNFIGYGLTELEGLKNSRAYNANTNTWSQLADMNFGRWYPALITLPDSKMFVASGVTKLIKPIYPNAPEQSGRNVVQTETYDPVTNKWTVNAQTAQRSLPLYPRIHLLPNGHVYYNAGGQAFNPNGQSYDQPLWNISATYNPANQTWSDLAYAGFPLKFSDAGLESLTQILNPQTAPNAAMSALTKTLMSAPMKSPQALQKLLSTANPGGNPEQMVQKIVGSGMRGSTFSVMMPLRPNAQGQYKEASFLTAGGVLPLVGATSPGGYVAVAASRIDTVKTDGDNIVDYQSEVTGSLNETRWYGSGVLIPDDSVMVFSGGDRDGVAAPGVEFPRKTAERFDPVTKKWTQMAVANNPRTYHNTALLMQDGRVLIGGHAPISTLYLKNINLAAFGFSPNDGRDPSFEIYSPPYVNNPNRPNLIGFAGGNATPVGNGKTMMREFRKGQQVTLEMAPGTDMSKIDSISLVRHTVTTHLTDADQRTVVIPKNQLTVTGQSIRFNIPDQAAVVPQGAYMTFVRAKQADGALLPSKAVSFMLKHDNGQGVMTANARR
ncbi:galactose oxidase-like domain-containing protein [uncultured Limnobacter sp.]|uniref:galactose oxidase-like domain-containing protein n=1 Tax=uncultured Limnobacter sp. TaxID=199681 RepID=UPI0030FB62CA